MNKEVPKAVAEIKALQAAGDKTSLSTQALQGHMDELADSQGGLADSTAASTDATKRDDDATRSGLRSTEERNRVVTALQQSLREQGKIEGSTLQERRAAAIAERELSSAEKERSGSLARETSAVHASGSAESSTATARTESAVSSARAANADNQRVGVLHSLVAALTNNSKSERDHESAVVSAERATLSVHNAEARLAELRKTEAAGSSVLARAELDLREARLKEAATSEAVRAVEKKQASDGNGLIGVLSRLTGAFGSSGAAAKLFGVALKGIGVLGVIGGLHALIGVVSALAAGVVALLPKLVQLGGLAGALPGAFLAAAQAGGVLYLALSGIGKVSEALASQAQSQATATKGLTSAGQANADSQFQEMEAQKALNDARQQALYQLQDLKNAVEQNAISEKRAEISLVEARRRLRELSTDPNAAPTNTDLSSAKLDVRQAQLDVKTAQQTQERGAAANRKAQREGVSGSDQVIQAQHALKQAMQQTTQAINAQSTQDANLAYAMSKLSKAGQDFARFWYKLKTGALQDLQQTAQTAFLPGLQKALQTIVDKLFPVFQKAITQTGGLLGKLAQQGANLFTSKAWTTDLGRLFKANLPVIQNVVHAIFNFLDALRNVAIAAQPLVNWLGKLVLGWSKTADASAEAGRQAGTLEEFFRKVIDSTKTMISIFSNLWGILKNVLGAGERLGNSLWDSIDRLTQKWEDWTGSIEGQNALKDWFQQAKPIITAAAKLVGALVVAIFGLGNTAQQATQGGLAKLLDMIRTQIVPAISDIINAIGTNFLAPFIHAVGQVLQAFAKLSGVAGTLVIVAKVIDAVATAFNRLADYFPIIIPLINGLVVALAALKIMTVVKDLLAGMATKLVLAGSAAASSEGAFAGAGVAAAGMGTAIQDALPVIGLIALAIEAVIAVLVLFWPKIKPAIQPFLDWLGKAWDAVKTFSEYLWEHFKPVLLGLAVAIFPLIGAIILLIKYWKQISSAVGSFLAGAWKELKPAIDGVVAAFKNLIDTARPIWEQLKQVVEGFWKVVQPIWESIKLQATALWRKWAPLVGLLAKVFAAAVVVGAINLIIGGIKLLTLIVSGVSVVVQTLADVWHTVWNGMSSLATMAGHAIIDIINGIISGVNLALKLLNLLPGVNVGQVAHVPTAPQPASVQPGTPPKPSPNVSRSGTTPPAPQQKLSRVQTTADTSGVGRKSIPSARNPFSAGGGPGAGGSLGIGGSGGIGAQFDAATTRVNAFNDALDKNKAAAKAYAQSTGQSFDEFRAAGVAAFRKGGEAQAQFVADMKAGLRQQHSAIADSLNTTDDILQSFAGQQKVNASTIEKSFSDQAKAMKDYGKLWSEVSKRGGKDAQGLLTQISSMGMDGIGILKGLSSANDKEFNSIVGKWNASGNSASDLATKIQKTLNQSIKGLTAAIEAIPGSANIKLGVDASDANNAIDGVLKKLKDNNLSLKAQQSISESQGGPGVTKTKVKHAGGWADEGPVSEASKKRKPDEVDTRLQVGEYVVRRSQAKKFGPLLKAINEGMLQPAMKAGKKMLQQAVYHTGGEIEAADAKRNRTGEAIRQVPGGHHVPPPVPPPVPSGGKDDRNKQHTHGHGHVPPPVPPPRDKKKDKGGPPSEKQIRKEAKTYQYSKVEAGKVVRRYLDVHRFLAKRGFYEERGYSLNKKKNDVLFDPRKIDYEAIVKDFVRMQERKKAARQNPSGKAVSGTYGGHGGGGPDGRPSSLAQIPVPKGTSGWEAYARDWFRIKEGWVGKDFRAIDRIITPESGWNPKAANPTSSARGIPQAMMSVHFGPNWQHDPAAQAFLRSGVVQIEWLDKYIKSRYGNPQAALRYRLSHGTYHAGGPVRRIMHSGGFLTGDTSGSASHLSAGVTEMPRAISSLRATGKMAIPDIQLPKQTGVSGKLGQWQKGPVPAPWGGFDNGRIPIRALVRIGQLSSGHPAYLAPDAASAYVAGHFPANAIVSAYRSYAQQASIYNSGVRPAAPPGSSMHGWGKALDVGGALSAAMHDHGPQFNWHSGASFGDPNHFSYGVTAALGGYIKKDEILRAHKGETVLNPKSSQNIDALTDALEKALDKTMAKTPATVPTIPMQFPAPAMAAAGRVNVTQPNVEDHGVSGVGPGTGMQTRDPQEVAPHQPQHLRLTINVDGRELSRTVELHAADSEVTLGGRR